MGKYTKEVEWKGYIYEVDKDARVTDKGIANTKTKKLVGKAPKSLLQKIGWGGNKGGLSVKKHLDFRKGGMVMNTTNKIKR